jgi:hypothetical protein
MRQGASSGAASRSCPRNCQREAGRWFATGRRLSWEGGARRGSVSQETCRSIDEGPAGCLGSPSMPDAPIRSRQGPGRPAR